MLCLSAITGGALHAQTLPRHENTVAIPPEGRTGIRILWYNTENLFHPDDDSLSQADDDFTPRGLRGWTYQRYRLKLAFLAKVIIAAGNGVPPEMVGLGEVEEQKVLEDLISHAILAPYGYRYVHSESPDHRGMDVACLYRPAAVVLKDWRAIPSVEEVTRDILYIRFSWGRRDSLDLFLVHLISKYRGSGETARIRKAQAEQLAGLLDSLAFIDDPEGARGLPRIGGTRGLPGTGGARGLSRIGGAGRLVVLAGDFNDEPGSYAMEPLLKCQPGGDTLICFPAARTAKSYKYRGRWSGIDRFYVTGAGERYRLLSGVMSHPSMLEPDEAYGGWKPFRTFKGYTYHAGFSDHLPVWMDVTRQRLLPGLFER